MERAFASRTVLRRTKDRGISGDADRYSIARNAARATAESPRVSPVAAVRNPSVAAFVRAYTRRTSPAVTVNAPGMSNRVPFALPGPAVMNRFARSAATMPIGTFTNITDLHPNASVRTPPRREPAANPADRTATTTPNALFRAGPSGYVEAR